MRYDEPLQNRTIYSELLIYILRTLNDGARFKNNGNVGFLKIFTKSIRNIMLFRTAKLHKTGEKPK